MDIYYNNRYVAFDFETANRKRSSACQLGIALVNNYELEFTKSWLINPEEEFEPLCVSIHGITEDDVLDAPPFKDIWPEVEEIFSSVSHLVAHNVSFDKGVLKALAEKYNFYFPDYSYIDSMGVAEHFWPNLPNYRLPTILKHIGMAESFIHHNAESDALGAAGIILAALCQNEEWTLKSFVNMKRDCFESAMEQYTSVTIDGHSFSEKHFAFTGATSEFSRKELITLIENRGGITHKTVTKNLDYLVVPDFMENDKGCTRKMRKAKEKIANGDSLMILTESKFKELVDIRECEIKDYSNGTLQA